MEMDKTKGISDRVQQKLASERITTKPVSINRVRLSKEDFVKTSQYLGIAKQLESLPTTVLHLYGLPGNGKSEIVRKLAQEFPFANIKPKVYIKWHIQCQNTGHDIKEALKELIIKLQKRYFLSCREDVQDILDSIDDDEAHVLTKTLKQLKVPVLLVIEDLKDKPINKEFVRKFLNSIDDVKEEEQDQSLHLASKLHVYFTTRKAPNRCSPSFKPVCVKGFSEEEGVSFLLKGDEVHKANETSARKVVKMFSGSPLGLRAARGYCRCTHKLDYSLYLKDVEEEDNEMHADEEEFLKRDSGSDAAQHIFKLIIKHFLEDEDLPKKTFAVLRCLSYFHYDLIPRQLIDKCCQLLSEDKQNIRRGKFTSGLIIENLLKHEVCSQDEDECISFHALILHAVQRHSLTNHQTADLLPLKMGIWVFASLVTKDLTKSVTSKSMYLLLIHGQKLLKYVKRYSQHLFTGVQRERFLLMATVSHLYETIGRIRMAKSPADLSLCDEYFKHALMINWHKSDTLASINTLCEENADVFQVAKKVFLDCQKAGRRLDLNFTTEWLLKLFMNFGAEEVNFLEKHCASSQTFLNEINSELSRPNVNNERILSLLRRYKLILDENIHRDVFFAERLSSIFHTWSRVLLFKDKFNQECLLRYEWLSRLSHAISAECNNVCGINLLFGHLSVASGTIPIILKSKDQNQLPEAMKMCEDLLYSISTEEQADSLYYEHGILSEIYVHHRKSGRISVLRHLVRIHTRLDYSLCSEKGDKACEELLELSKEQLGKVSIAGICIVHCAKYLASRKRYAEALHCTKVFLFDRRSNPRSHNVYSWGVYNHSRVVLCGELFKEKDAAVSLCKSALHSNEMIGQSLHQRLHKIVEKLEGM